MPSMNGCCSLGTHTAWVLRVPAVSPHHAQGLKLLFTHADMLVRCGDIPEGRLSPGPCVGPDLEPLPSSACSPAHLLLAFRGVNCKAHAT